VSIADADLGGLHAHSPGLEEVKISASIGVVLVQSRGCSTARRPGSYPLVNLEYAVVEERQNARYRRQSS